MSAAMVNKADMQSQELQKHVLRREAELRDKEREVEARGWSWFAVSISVEDNNVVKKLLFGRREYLRHVEPPQTQ